MSGTQVSSAPNVLFDPLMARRQTQMDTTNQNELLQQQVTQQSLGSNEIEMMSRAASGLLQVPEADRPAAYAQSIADLQRSGFAKNAPSVYPGEAALHRVAMMGMSAKDQLAYGQTQASLAQVDAALGHPASTASTGGTGGTGGGAGGTPLTPPPAGAYGQGGKGAATEVPKEYLPYYQEASAKYGIPVDLLIAQHRQESNFNPNARGRAGEIGLGQIMPSTALAPGYGMASVDPATLTDPRANIMFSAEYLARRMRGDPRDPEVQRRALVAYNGGGDPNYVANVTRYLPGSYPATQTAAVQAQPQAPPPPTQQASNTPPAPAPVGSQGLVRNADGSVGTPNAGGLATPPPQQANAQPQGTPQAPATPPPYQEASTTPTPPPTAPAPAAPPPPQDGTGQPPPGMTVGTRGSEAQPPAGVDTLANGLTAQQDALIRGRRASARTPADVQSMLSDIASMQAANSKHNLEAWQASHPNIRATPVPGVDAAGNVGSWMVQGDKRVGFIPSPVRPANAPWELQKSDYEKDAKDLPELNTSAQAAQANQIRIQKMRELVDQVSSGAGGNWRAAWANVAETAGFHGWAQSLIGKDSTIADPAAAAQEFAKLSLVSAGTAERRDLGSRGSLGAIQLYKAANPGLDLRPDANKRILAMQLISEQANIDYSTQALAFANAAGDTFERGGNYQKLSHFDSQWTAQRNPQIYAAAMSAISGDDYGTWTKALNMKSAADRAHVIEIIRRADPTAAIKWKDGQSMGVGQPDNG